MATTSIVVNINDLKPKEKEHAKIKKIITPGEDAFLTLLAKTFVKHILSQRITQ